ncbi:MAG TPA: hypothetical protein VF520_15805 [Thermoleophilaceae bacterium]
MAFAAAIVAVALGVLSWRVPPGSGRLGLDVRVLAASSGELAATRTGPIASASGLEPGRSVSGTTSLRNQTGSVLAVRLRALPSSRDADASLRVELRSGGRVLYSGPLGGLRRPTRASFRLAPTRSAEVSARAWVPAAAEGWRGRIVDVQLEPVARPVRGRP